MPRQGDQLQNPAVAQDLPAALAARNDQRVADDRSCMRRTGLRTASRAKGLRPPAGMQRTQSATELVRPGDEGVGAIV